MYIWKITELKKQLINSDLEEAESFKYLMANTVLFTAATIQYGETNQFDTLSGVISLFTAVLGTWIAYKVNGEKDGNHFVQRYLAICWVIFVRFFALIALPLIIVNVAIEEFFLGGVPTATTLSDVFFICALEATYIAMVARHVSHVAKNSRHCRYLAEDAQQGLGPA